MVDKLPLHPPLAVVVTSHAAKDASMTVCDWHAASVLSLAQVKMTSGALSTVNVFVQDVVSGAQVLV
jgi:hypothetical protein